MARVGGAERGPDDGGSAVNRVRVTFADDPRHASAEARARTIERCAAALVAAGIGVREVRPSGGSLEDVFASLTQEAPASEPPSPPRRAGVVRRAS